MTEEDETETDAEPQESKDLVENVKERFEGMEMPGSEILDSYDVKKVGGIAAAAVAVVAVLVLAVGNAGPGVENASADVKLTDYQKQYVDCPAKYLDTCTKMSKIPSEPVTYWKKQEGNLYLKLADGRAIISTLPNSTSTGEFVTYMSAAEVEAATKTSENSQGSNGSSR